MRSLSYILTGRPHNRSDCIDHARAHAKLRRVSVELHTHEDVTDEFVARTLFATYVWVFEDTVVTYEETYGRVFQHEQAERQRLSVDNANRRLSEALESLRRRAGCAVEGGESRFDHGAGYCGG